jgi:ATP-dependent DNA helicase RecQ
VPTLENFAYGDTPTEPALAGMLKEILSLGNEFDVSLYDLSARHDIRLLVLRTALTYLELLGVLRQGTPFYNGYEFRPLIPLEDIFGKFPGERGQFIADLFQHARKGKTWYSINPDALATAMSQDRTRIIRALEYLAEQGWVELRTAEVRYCYTRLIAHPPVDQLLKTLVARFQKKEQHELQRIGQVLELVTHPGCQTNALVSYFGETRPEPCGHCMHCATSKILALPPMHPRPALPAGINENELRTLVGENHPALAHPRQLARFLCGLSSPATTKAKLSRHELFGIWEDRPFAQVLEWCGKTTSGLS